MKLYQPVNDLNLWQGRKDAKANEYIFQMVQALNLNFKPAHLSGFGLLGFPSDLGISRNFGRVGAKDGPNAFRQAFGRLSSPYPLALYDAGNMIVDELESAQLALAEGVSSLLNLGLMPIVIGGGHETAFGHYLGLKQHYPDDDIAIVNFDAHFDLRQSDQANSGTPFRQIYEFLNQKHAPFHYHCIGIQPFANPTHLFDFANRHQVNYLMARNIEQVEDFIEKVIATHQKIYVSICLDVFNASIAPGVSAPQALGIFPNPVISALQKLKQSQKVIALDIVELSPIHDIDHQTAKLASQLLLHFLTA